MLRKSVAAFLVASALGCGLAYADDQNSADQYMDRLAHLHEGCDGGNRGACIQFGMLIGEHKEHVAEWRRSHPDFFNY